MSAYSYANVYTKTAARAMTWYVSNGFFARDLDADDWQFVEHVRSCGIANGQEPSANSFLLEEQEYWAYPYSVDHSVTRRVGPIKPVVYLPDPDAAARRAKRIANKRSLEQARAEAQAEWDEQQARLAYEREQRLLRTMEADLLWENEHSRASNLNDDESFAPSEDYVQRYRSSRYSFDLPARHYVPEWRRRKPAYDRELGAVREDARKRYAKREAKREKTMAEIEQAARLWPLSRSDELEDILRKVRSEEAHEAEEEMA